ncbi:hypothetical protein [Brevibacterium pigmentatum]|uniref:hypothetical protein n=1 Tax=Brevibacterium pigmentatum TaxID=1496080 RepID=UPI00142383F6|nr:hypothetical protein [Brevibacterium pigmentatum]
MSNNIDRKYTFDLDNQPGIANKAISRSQIRAAIEALGLDPSAVTELHMQHDAITITALMKDIEGHRVLGAPDAVAPDDDLSGFLKHTYTARICDDSEAAKINKLREG